MKKKAIIVICILFSFIFLSSIAKETVAEVPEEIVEDDSYVDLVSYYNENPDELKNKTQPITDAKWLATIADAVAPDSDDYCKTAIMQCIINRTRTTGFPNSIEDVCSQKNQWQGYENSSTYTYETYKVAKELVDSLGEYRVTPIETNMVYLRVGVTGLYFRASWDATNETYIPYYS